MAPYKNTTLGLVSDLAQREKKLIPKNLIE